MRMYHRWRLSCVAQCAATPAASVCGWSGHWSLVQAPSVRGFEFEVARARFTKRRGGGNVDGLSTHPVQSMVLEGSWANRPLVTLVE